MNALPPRICSNCWIVISSFVSSQCTKPEMNTIWFTANFQWSWYLQQTTISLCHPSIAEGRLSQRCNILVVQLWSNNGLQLLKLVTKCRVMLFRLRTNLIHYAECCHARHLTRMITYLCWHDHGPAGLSPTKHMIHNGESSLQSRVHLA
jgi:hypothetical protein